MNDNISMSITIAGSMNDSKNMDSNVNEWQQKHGQQGQWMFVANWLITEKVEFVG